MQVFAAVVLLLSGCARVAQQAGSSEPVAPVSGKGQMLPGSEVRASGFLRDYSQLKAVQGKPARGERVYAVVGARRSFATTLKSDEITWDEMGDSVTYFANQWRTRLDRARGVGK